MSATKYFPVAKILVVDDMAYFKSQSLQSYFKVAFSHFINQSRFSLQTSILAGEHCLSRASSIVWKRAMSIRGTEIGSGLIMPAENEAFAIARE